MSRVYLCITIDCECDKGPGWRTQRPRRFAGISDGIGQRLQPLFRAYRAKPTYLISPEVLRDEASVALFAGLRAGAELGTHLHGEYAAPGAHDPEVTSAFQRDYPPELERRKLGSLTDDFALAFGFRPASFRAGRFGIGPHTLGFLADLGYRVDSSVTPGIDWGPAGAPGLDFRRAPTQPYRPDLRQPAETGAAPLLEVPITTHPHRLAWLPGLGKRLRARWLRPTWGTARALPRLAEREIARARAALPARPVVLCAMFHNVEVVPGASPYARNEAQASAILARLAALLDHARAHGIAVIGLGDVPGLFAAPALRPARPSGRIAVSPAPMRS